MTVPGAFAKAICRCVIARAGSLPPIPPIDAFTAAAASNRGTVRPKKLVPTDCVYESINSLRDDVNNRNDLQVNEQLRGSTYVGAVSRHRSLIQFGVDLLLINHRELAKEMFYQLALTRFGGVPMADLGNGVDVAVLVGQMLQFEENLHGDNRDNAAPAVGVAKVNRTNDQMAHQATTCLEEHAGMLEEYFSIRFEMRRVPRPSKENRGKWIEVDTLHLTGLPILLEGHSPPPYGVPLFLMRLATEVDWTGERECFQGVCTELGSFYAEVPYAEKTGDTHQRGDEVGVENKVDGAGSGDDGIGDGKAAVAPPENRDLVDDEAKKYVQHTLFPAISFLLVPPKESNTNRSVRKLANLTSLYKVFERC